MNEYVRLAAELTTSLRALKELHVNALGRTELRCELAGAMVLSRLDALGPVRLTDLALALGLDPSSVSRQVTALERAGLVARERDPSDLRAQRLVVTREGTEAVTSLRAARAAALATLTPGWTADDLDDLTHRLARLNTDLEANRALLGSRQETA
jgi:DNA-binding MarR family transcriptional regulator